MRVAYLALEVHELASSPKLVPTPLILFGTSPPCSPHPPKPWLQVDRNLMLYLPRLAVLVSIGADRPGA